MEIKRDKVSICNYICSALMVVLIVLQFIPYWSFGGQSSIINGKEYQSKKGQSISINSYVWSNPENTDLILYFAEKLNGDITVQKEGSNLRVPLEAISNKDDNTGVYVKTKDSFKYTEVEVVFKDSTNAFVKYDSENGLHPDDKLAVAYTEDVLKEEYSHYLDVIGAVSCWQITLALVGIGFCLVKKKSGIFAAFPLINGILGTFGYRTGAELQLSGLWKVAFTVNILIAVCALVTIVLHIYESVKSKK